MGFVHRHRWSVPYLLLAPGLAFLALFFVVPIYYLASTSLQTGSLDVGYTFTWAWSNYSDAIRTYDEHFIRSLQYSAIATVAALVISYPLAYFIAFRGGRWKNLLLLLVIAPFFVTYLIRTLAWQTILTDDGLVADALRSIGLLSDDGRLLATSTAVVAGITYNFLPFMALPLYVSLEQIDTRLVEAATDLYASRVQAFLRVTLPLSLPGVFAGTLLTFIPAMGDFVTPDLLGGAGTTTIAKVVQELFLEGRDWPYGAALGFVLMVITLAGTFLALRPLRSEVVGA